MYINNTSNNSVNKITFIGQGYLHGAYVQLEKVLNNVKGVYRPIP